MTTVGLIVVAAGSSTRMGGTDKVWAALGNHPVLWHSLARVGGAASSTVLVVHPSRLNQAMQVLRDEFPALAIVPGGSHRQDSVARGLEAMPPVDVIAVHDAARPFASARMVREGMALLGSHAGAIPVEPVLDTIKRVSEDGLILQTLDRSMLRAAQTPQVFRAQALRSAHAAVAGFTPHGTDDASLLEASAMTVGAFPGHRSNFKITNTYDLIVAGLLLEHPEVLES